MVKKLVRLIDKYKPEEIWGILNGIANISVPHIYRATPAICGLSVEKQREDLIGTGVLVEFGNDVFLITARHVVEDNKKNENLSDEENQERYDYLSIICGHKTRSLIFDDATPFVFSNKDFDLAFVKLTNKQIQYIKTVGDRTPLGILSLAPFYHELGTDHVGVFGYPVDRSEEILGGRGVSVELQPYVSIEASSVDVERFQIDPLNHYLLEYHKEGNQDSLGQDAVASDPTCMSGGPVVAMRTNLNPKQVWNQGDMKLIGIVTDWFEKENFVKVTRLGQLLQLMAMHYPELEDMFNQSFEVWRP